MRLNNSTDWYTNIKHIHNTHMVQWEGGQREGRGTPHNLVLSLLLLPLAQDDPLDDGAFLRREVRQVRHVVHGGRPRAERGPAVLRCCARGATLSAPLAPEVYLAMPSGPMARNTTLTSARLLIQPARPQRTQRRRRLTPFHVAFGGMRAHPWLTNPWSIYIFF